jgi:hypothetical protein
LERLNQELEQQQLVGARWAAHFANGPPQSGAALSPCLPSIEQTDKANQARRPDACSDGDARLEETHTSRQSQRQ